MLDIVEMQGTLENRGSRRSLHKPRVDLPWPNHPTILLEGEGLDALTSPPRSGQPRMRRLPQLQRPGVEGEVMLSAAGDAVSRIKQLPQAFNL